MSVRFWNLITQKCPSGLLKFVMHDRAEEILTESSNDERGVLSNALRNLGLLERKTLFREFHQRNSFVSYLNVRSPQARKFAEITGLVPFSTATPVNKQLKNLDGKYG